MLCPLNKSEIGACTTGQNGELMPPIAISAWLAARRTSAIKRCIALVAAAGMDNKRFTVLTPKLVGIAGMALLMTQVALYIKIRFCLHCMQIIFMPCCIFASHANMS